MPKAVSIIIRYFLHKPLSTRWREEGIVYSSSDEHGVAIGMTAYVYDFHATILHLLGLDLKALCHAGRDYRLTDVAGNVVRRSWHNRSSENSQFCHKEINAQPKDDSLCLNALPHFANIR
ncbi:MAG: DUF1501 domain-containing protein [Pirellulales bacterium]